MLIRRGRESIYQRLKRLEVAAGLLRREDHPYLTAIKNDPTQVMTLGGMPPDPWQEQLLQSQADRFLLLCSRQVGKSTVAAALALRIALIRPRSPILVLAPTERQSGELVRKIAFLFNQLNRPVNVVRESALQVEFANGSRIISLPGNEATVRGFSDIAMLIIDEASRVADSLYYAVRPMLAVSRGSLVALSTPFGKRGWFHDEWDGSGDWQRIKITADQCPRIAPQFLEEERRALGDRWFRQEYMCEFNDTIDAVFSYSDIQSALSDEVKPLFVRSSP
jgi:hypothetical protein